MKDHYDSQFEVFRSLIKGICPRQRAPEVSSVIFSAVCGGRKVSVLEESRGFRETLGHLQESSELTCTALTVVEKIHSRLASESLSAENTLYCKEVSRLLFQERDLMFKLVHLFKAKDRTVSHLAAKAASTYALYQLQTYGSVSPSWEQKCVSMFQNPSPCHELEACMWSLASVLKRVLQRSGGEHTEIMDKLLTTFDQALCALCSKLLPGERREEEMDESQPPVVFTNTPGWGTTYSTLLTLMEVLTASRSLRTTRICSQSQRLTHTHSAALLRLITISCDYFVKKQVMLLLKKALVHKAGEDMALWQVAVARDQLFISDTSTLANAVLQAMHSDWLQLVPVEEAACFLGGTSQSCSEGRPKSDYVMLRAISLVLLKTMEFHVQMADGKGVDSDTPAFLQALLLFLTQQGFWSEEHRHCCSWLTQLFVDQDDDLMEAAKAMLSLHKYHSAPCGLNTSSLSDSACSSGSNPHCHFLFLLRSLSYDHSILLDFLISTETCFLEYFVRYLKLLRGDWQGFLMACRRMDTQDRPQLDQRQPEPCGVGGSGLSWTKEPRDESGTRPDPIQVQPSVCETSARGTSLVPGLRLVDYGSSEESDPEDMEVSEDSRDLEVRHMVTESTSSKEVPLGDSVPTPDLMQLLPIWHHRPCPVPKGTEPGLSGSTPKAPTPSSPRLGTRTRSLCPILAQSRCVAVPKGVSGHCSELCRPGVSRSGQTLGPGDETSVRVVSCLSELRGVMAKLQRKNLFPYNASCLLKLLLQVHTTNKCQS